MNQLHKYTELTINSEKALVVGIKKVFVKDDGKIDALVAIRTENGVCTYYASSLFSGKPKVSLEC